MAKSVRIDVPYNSPEQAIDLGQSIIDQHTQLGADSPIPPNLVAKLTPKVTAAVTKRKTAIKMKKDAEALMQEAGNEIGIGKGMTTTTPDTGMFVITQIRDILAGAYKGNEEKISTFGFNVVVSG